LRLSQNVGFWESRLRLLYIPIFRLRRRLFSPAVLLGFLLFLPLFNGFPQTGAAGGKGKELAISVLSSPENPVTGGTWTVTILVEHPVPQEVSVRPPRFPSSLVLERVRTELRLLTKPGRSDEAGPPPHPVRWTAVEFLFTPREAGEITLAPFEAAAGGRRAATREISVRFRDEAGAAPRYTPVFRWERPASPFTAGEAGELRLALAGWDPKRQAPRDIFKGKAPLNAVLEELSPVLSGGEFIYPLSIIPLEEGAVVLESFSFQWEGLSLQVPSLSLRVRPEAAAPPKSAAPAEAAPAETTGPGSGDGGREPGPFPETGGRVFPLFRAEYGRIVSEVRRCWEEGGRARALAEIRRKERESWAGPALAALRRKMEQRLGLSLTADETWRPRNVPVFLWLGLPLCVIAAVLLLRRRFSAGFSAVTSGKTSGYKTRAIFIALICIAAAASAVRLLAELPGGAGKAVLEKTSVYRVPEKQGAVSALFSEGQPVTIGASRGEWVYVESADGRAGWVPAASVIRY
jgi:hypothetical protein